VRIGQRFHGTWAVHIQRGTRALRAARKAGAHVARAEIARDGKIVLVLNKDGEARCGSERNEWDEINGED
jgi:hypothetical protein